ncbi:MULTISPECIES: hypothetical protein [unclassified Nostoc]|uniref:hypothetical protein n=1 Tax=unclassified Nostoc TaxID=2593658 RepID=UPI002AD41FDD|nr:MULTISPECIES: hypothetical protein [unclassified Nostoc]MDZ7984387.1 hypothetical protein [Nostoc sp. DedVER02]MDZ8115066.1 hypothetical protein [Nostoc sp. DedVER01b]
MSDALEKAVMHNKYLAKINFLEIKPQMNADNALAFICGSFFSNFDFCSKSNVQYKKPAMME